MKLKNWLSILLIGLSLPVFAQESKKTVYVIVHGAWGGSYAFKKVDSILTAKGCKVYRPSLTGQGERAHLASADVNLSTHVKDVVNQILYENLDDVVLVGHSYGGMVITGVVDSIPDRIKKMIYVDAFLPNDGESVVGLFGGKVDGLVKNQVNGFLVPAWVKASQPIPKDVPQSLKTFTEILHLKRGVSTIPAHYVLTVAKGTLPENDDFASQAERARKRNIPVEVLAADHNPQVSAIVPFAELLYKLK
ncbi:alpha/beta hydrolase [Pedobacter frigiditerrae]|uniref:Alpha/beta hydrolase n=1 Tax=Pedobacter frigiditerrae TaxID=2530452 RepID=A0A4R0MTW0_9SPHI|nr:alpha/beta fold hydrolase [Pedobacter frigiditerrae]TCC90157.1 alpha/beta hydrolase [Pedobacter frigiditerrae]